MTVRNTPVDSPYQPDPYFGSTRPPGSIDVTDNSTYTSDYDIIEIWDPVKNKAVQFSYFQLKAWGWMPDKVLYGSLGTYWQPKIQARYEQELLGSFGGGGGGGGGGRVGPNYVKPSEDAVRESVKAYVIATTGTADSALIDQGVAAYMKGSKSAFDNRETEQVDPWTFVQDTVRSSSTYKKIHQLRPDSVDEMDWVVDRQAKLRSLGVSSDRAETLGVKQATVAANDEALVGAAEMQFNADTGRMLASQRDRLKRAGSAAMGLL